MPNPLLSGTAYVGVGALAQKYGWEYFDKLKANGIKVESGNTALQEQINQGEYDVMCGSGKASSRWAPRVNR